MYYRDENEDWQEIILEPSGDTLPIGAITQFSGENAPTNWLICDGSAVSRTTYAELFDVIGTTYGDGDGSTTFNVPDFIGRVPVGLDAEDTDFDTLGETGGSKELQSHNHRQTYYLEKLTLGSSDSAIMSGGVGVTTGNSNQYTTNTGEGDSGNLQPYTVTNFIIKAKQSIGVVGTVSEDITDTNNNAVPNCETVKDYVDGLNTYSTTEAVVGTWLGKPLYRKTFYRGDDITTFDHNISDVDLIWIDTTHSFRKHGSGNVFNLVGGTNDSSVRLAMYVNSTQVVFNNVGSVAPTDVWVTLEYTKTTN